MCSILKRYASGMAFVGWPPAATKFYEALEADNSREFWHANKQTYDACVRAPMEALLADLAREFGEGRIFRPNRDTRFSHDKTPYKTAIAARIGASGYVQFSADGLGVGSGMYMMATDQLDRYRRAVADDRHGRALERVVAQVRGKGVDVHGHEQLKRAPRGYPQDHPRIDLLRNKGLVAWREWPAGRWLRTAEAKDRVVATLRAAKPLNAWLRDHVGDSALTDA
jgi:uncharacterized protein (TIGR02453 family)